ncbi:LysR substrate-binding domain-containing protein [uncultured Vibrio sp.]|uniref:LysR substrate-binding domain-containing protein n=1 Tax=uncultured Vibrio sp. TaxID=114054 RepID=UPI00090FD171|nr:LysR substrate-binding domain-containing protein [uncultured Vibrio sp.]OIQ24782.1 MAG: transcriptional regulator [Vibrio sp. MedPE-SWchi]
MANNQLLLRNLHTFNVAAQKMSFTLAAKKLHLTQGAVSHRIKVLEGELGFNLFVRGTRQLELTEEGERFQRTLSKSLSSIFGEIEDINNADLYGQINIGTSPAFANDWLIPRIADFKQRYPKFNLNIFSQEEQNFHQNHLDIAIYYGASDLKDMYRRRMFDEKYVPVCTPSYAKKYGIFEDGLDSLHRINFIHALGSDVWQRWIKYFNLDVNLFTQFYCVSHRDMGVKCALNEVGVAMGRFQFVKSYIESGELVTPYPSMDTDLGYELLCPLGTEKRPKVRTFINWIDDQLAQ